MVGSKRCDLLRCTVKLRVLKWAYIFWLATDLSSSCHMLYLVDLTTNKTCELNG